jgi:hypothetical protein
VKGPTLGLSQQAVKAGSSLILVTQVRVASSSVNAGTVRYCQTGRARQARREGVRVQEPAVEPPQVRNRPQTWRTWVGQQCTPRMLLLLSEATPKPVRWAGGEATRNACGVLVARLQGNSWAPHPSIGQ